jgi:enoyl-CoA hydratase/carnithine racemase
MRDPIVKVTRNNQVAVVSLNRNTTNAINLELVQQLANILTSLKQDSEVHGLVLGSNNNKFFSIGFDIPHLYGIKKGEFRIFYSAFNRLCVDLYTYPKPTIAAITGHAVAGGCILALCCDYRYIGEGNKKMGLNEIKLGVPLPYPVDCILQQLVGFRTARDVVDTGEFFEPALLLSMGIVDRIVPQAQVLGQSIEKIRSITTHPPDAFSAIKQSRTETVEARINAGLKEKENTFIDYWYSDRVRTLLQEAIAKF